MLTTHSGFILTFPHLEKLSLSVFGNREAQCSSQGVMSPLQQSWTCTNGAGWWWCCCCWKLYKGSGVEIADGELGSGDGRGGAERSLDKRLSYLLRRTAKSESRGDFIGGAPSTATNPVILKENCKCSLFQKLSAHCS